VVGQLSRVIAELDADISCCDSVPPPNDGYLFEWLCIMPLAAKIDDAL